MKLAELTIEHYVSSWILDRRVYVINTKPYHFTVISPVQLSTELQLIAVAKFLEQEREQREKAGDPPKHSDRGSFDQSNEGAPTWSSPI